MASVQVLRSEVNTTGTPGAQVNIYRSEVMIPVATAAVMIFESQILAPFAVSATASPTTAEPFSIVTLTGGGGNPNSDAVSWTQISGTPVQVFGTGTNITFEAPGTLLGDTVIFRYNVDGATADVQVTVYPVTERAVIDGSEVPLRLVAASIA